MRFVNILPAVTRHYDTLRVIENPHTGKTRMRRRDQGLLFGVPLLAGVASALLGVSARLDSLLGGIAILAGGLFALVVFVFELRVNSHPPAHLPENTILNRLVDELFHNALYAAIVASVTCVAVLVFTVTALPGPVETGVTFALCAHLGLTGMLCVKRLSQAYVEAVKEKKRISAHT